MRPFRATVWMPCVALVLGSLLVAGCADDTLTPIGDGSSTAELREQVRYTLDAGPHQGAVPDSIDLRADVLMQSVDSARTLVTVSLRDTLHTPRIYPVYLRANSADTTGPVLQPLGAIDNAVQPAGQSRHLVPRPLDSLRVLDAHITIHEQAMPRDTVLARGNVGANASAQPTLFQLERPTPAATATYPLGPVANGRSEVPGGIAGTIRFEALSPARTLVEVRRTDAGPSTTRAHPVHLRIGLAGAGGDIAFYLGALDGTAPPPASSWAVVPRAFDALVAFDGHVRVSWSNETLETVLGAGNIGANAP